MHETISSAPMCSPRVRKLCTHATASCAGSALLNIDCRIRSVAWSLESDSLRNMMVLTHSALATCRASYPSCGGPAPDQSESESQSPWSPTLEAMYRPTAMKIAPSTGRIMLAVTLARAL